MYLFRLLSLFFLLFTLNKVYANEQAYVVAFSSGFTEDKKQTYGISSYETLGKGRWGLYGELLFAYEKASFQHCDEACQKVEVTDKQLNFTVGGSYGLTNNLYALTGIGIRTSGISSAPYNNAAVCEPGEEYDVIHHSNKSGEQYCASYQEIGLAAQLGLLYVTPLGLSIAGTIDTEQTATLSVGFQF